MKKRLLVILKNFGFTLSANLITLLVALLVTLIVPKTLSVEQYGYFQLYLFYASYLGVLQFGWSDGLYLRLGGENYSNLNKQVMFSQFWTLVGFQIIVSIVLIVMGLFFIENQSKIFIILVLGLILTFVGSRAMLLLVFQTTGRFVDASKIMILDRLVYLCIVLFLLFIKIDDFKYIILAEIVGKIVAWGYALYLARDIVFSKISLYRFEGREIYYNIHAGMNLTLAGVAGMLVLGVIRFGVERVWDVETFGQVSLILSISSMAMVFVGAMSLVLFPMLKRIERESLPVFYTHLRNMLMPILLILPVLYFPMAKFLVYILPSYEFGIKYMFLVFPIIVFEGKMSLLIGNVLKVLRYEKMMFRINMIALLISIAFTFIFATWLHNLYLTMLSILLVLGIRSIIAEKLLSGILNIESDKEMQSEVVMVGLFVFLTWYTNAEISLISYLIVYAFYIVSRKNLLVQSIFNIKSLVEARKLAS